MGEVKLRATGARWMIYERMDMSGDRGREGMLLR